MSNGLLDIQTAQAIKGVKGASIKGARMGKWLTRAQAQELLDAPDASTLKGKRDVAMLAVLLGAGLRRGEVAALTVEHIQQRDGRWVIVELLSKHGRVRSIPIASWIKCAIDRWIEAAGITEGRLFRRMNRHGRITGASLTDEAVYVILGTYARRVKLTVTPHDMRRTFAQLARKGHSSNGTDPDEFGTCLGADDRALPGHAVGPGGRAQRPHQAARGGGMRLHKGRGSAASGRNRGRLRDCGVKSGVQWSSLIV